MSGAALAHEQLERYVTRESASVPAGLSASATVA
jgi:hypothetical protein